jgi:hypothetical protein
MGIKLDSLTRGSHDEQRFESLIPWVQRVESLTHGSHHEQRFESLTHGSHHVQRFESLICGCYLAGENRGFDLESIPTRDAKVGAKKLSRVHAKVSSIFLF